MSLRLACITVSTALALTFSRETRADDVAVAKAQFEAGRAEMDAGQYASACPKIGESFRLDPRPGTLFTLAACEHAGGKVASAVAHYESYLKMYDGLPPVAREAQRTRPGLARDAIRELSPRVSKLAIVLEPGWPPSTTVTKDGVALGKPSLGLSLPTDAGEHTVVATAEGFAPRESTLRLAEGEVRELRIPLSSRVAASEPGDRVGTGRGDGQRATAFVMGGVGIGGILVGVVGGSIALAAKSGIDERCGPDKVCVDEAARQDAEDAQTAALVSTVGFIAGGALLGASIVVYLTAPSDEPSPTVHLGARTVAGGGVVEGGITW